MRIRNAGAHAVRLLVCAACCFALCAAAQAKETVTFVGVHIDADTRDADRRLQDYLEREADLGFDFKDLEYGAAIRRLVGWDPADGVVIARTTPYVQVASVMLGAELEVLATYVSNATGKTTYQSYYVVRKDEVPSNATPADVIAFVSRPPPRVRFTYHNLFSTSSFFLPSLHLRANRVFHMPESTDALTAIEVFHTDETSSSHLVRAVAEKRADLAAVWDGTRERFVGASASAEDAAIGREVVFVPLPSALPNDLLVCSRSAPVELKERIRKAIGRMPEKEIAVGDFSGWVDIRDASEARAALAQLGWMAREQVAPVTVDVRPGRGAESGTATLVEAARHALRLSETELVLFDHDFHEQMDMVWTLDVIHDGSALLTTSIPEAGVPSQVFPISFRDADDLTRRIVAVIQARLHRIRYVWPYSGDQPMVIRDTTLPMPRGEKVPVQRITWLNPERNSFSADAIFDVTVVNSSLFVHEFYIQDFRVSGGMTGAFDPMSNVSYRAYQLRADPSSDWFRFATGALVVLLFLAALSAFLAVRRRRREDVATTDRTAA